MTAPEVSRSTETPVSTTLLCFDMETDRCFTLDCAAPWKRPAVCDSVRFGNRTTNLGIFFGQLGAVNDAWCKVMWFKMCTVRNLWPPHKTEKRLCCELREVTMWNVHYVQSEFKDSWRASGLTLQWLRCGGGRPAHTGDRVSKKMVD